LCIEAEATGGHSELVGYALDGFGIFGRYGEDGDAVRNTDLDECHGHNHDIEWDGATIEMYHYHATWEYPYTLGCYRGTPIVTNTVRGAGGNGGQQPPDGGERPRGEGGQQPPDDGERPRGGGG
jgi:hypothetical protein